MIYLLIMAFVFGNIMGAIITTFVFIRYKPTIVWVIDDAWVVCMPFCDIINGFLILGENKKDFELQKRRAVDDRVPKKRFIRCPIDNPKFERLSNCNPDLKSKIREEGCFYSDPIIIYKKQLT